MFQKILLAADGSAHSIRAAENTLKLIQEKETGFVTIVYVVDVPTSKTDVLHNKDESEIFEKRKEKLKDVISPFESSSISYELKILHGDPGESIVQYANDRNFDCLVIGSRGHNLLHEMLLGSVSHKVAKRVMCPVLIVK